MGKLNRANLKKTLYYLKRNGLVNTWHAVWERLGDRPKEPYCFKPVTQQEWEQQRARSRQGEITFSIVVPAYRTVEKYLDELIRSVAAQSYTRWELIIADATADDSVERAVGQIVNREEGITLAWEKQGELKAERKWLDSCIRYVKLAENKGIAGNTNEALPHVLGDYVGLLDHDDVLTKDALYEMAAAIEERKEAGVEVQMLYSDEDKCDSDCLTYYEPHFKEDFNLDLLLSNNYICHFLVMKTELMRELGFRQEFNGAQDYDLVLRAAERLMERECQIVHIPKVLYHWRCHAASTAENPQSKQYAYEAGGRALQDFADRQGWNARACYLKHLGFYTLQYPEGVLETRNDIGVIGGALVSKGAKSIIGGRMDENGRVLYQGLPTSHSGYMHRAVLTQDAEALDVRCMQVKPELYGLFEEVTGVSYRKLEKEELFDASLLPEDTDYIALSLSLSKAIREKGYRLLYLPDDLGKWKWNAKEQRLER